MVLGTLGLGALTHASYMYPLQEISTTACLSQTRDQSDASCKRLLPRLENANYSLYVGIPTLRYVYPVLYASSYDSGWDEQGSHGGVDILTASGTPVYAIADGTVVDAKYDATMGNEVTLKFQGPDGQTLIAYYMHLSSYGVKKGDKVTMGQVLGKVGKTGFVIGKDPNHLFFEINKTQNGNAIPAFQGCDPTDSSKDYYTIVNDGLCRDNLIKNTLDPIAFLESVHASIGHVTIADIVATGTVVTPPSSSVVAAAVSTPTGVASTVTLNSASLKDKAAHDKTAYAMAQLLDTYTVAVYVDSNAVTHGDTLSLDVTLTNKNDGSAFDGTLPSSITFMSTSPVLKLNASTIQLVKNGKISLPVQAAGHGNGTIAIMIDNVVIAKQTVTVN